MTGVLIISLLGLWPPNAPFFRQSTRFLALSVSDSAEDVVTVIRAGALGYSYKEVAKELFISIKTVETHVSAVLRKLQLSSRYELTRWAAERRLL